MRDGPFGVTTRPGHQRFVGDGPLGAHHQGRSFGCCRGLAGDGPLSGTHRGRSFVIAASLGTVLHQSSGIMRDGPFGVTTRPRPHSTFPWAQTGLQMFFESCLQGNMRFFCLELDLNRYATTKSNYFRDFVVVMHFYGAIFAKKTV